MDNEAWIPLKQSHYPPPSIPSMKTGHPTGPLSPGHIIPDLRHLDNVINSNGFEPFPQGMDIMTATLEKNTFKNGVNTEIILQANAEAPIVAMIPGMDASAGAGTNYTNFISNSWEYGRLEEYVVQPTRSYIERCLESEEVKDYIRRRNKMGGWKVYMITGIMVARGGGRNVCSEEKGVGIFGSVNL